MRLPNGVVECDTEAKRRVYKRQLRKELPRVFPSVYIVMFTDTYLARFCRLFYTQFSLVIDII